MHGSNFTVHDISWCFLTFPHLSLIVAHPYMILPSHKKVAYFLETFLQTVWCFFHSVMEEGLTWDSKRMPLRMCAASGYTWVFVLSIIMVRSGTRVSTMVSFMTSVNISLCCQWACNSVQLWFLCRLRRKEILEVSMIERSTEKGYRYLNSRCIFLLKVLWNWVYPESLSKKPRTL